VASGVAGHGWEDSVGSACRGADRGARLGRWVYSPSVSARIRWATQQARDVTSQDQAATLISELIGAGEAADPGMLVKAVASALRKLSAGGLCVVVLDDLQWADHATLRLLTALAPRLERERVLVIGAYRDDQLPRGHGLRFARAELGRMGKLHELRLGRLDGAPAAALVEAIVGAGAAAVLAAAINERAEGLPFFVVELAHALAERLEAGDAGPVESLPIPESVSDAVLVQAALLSEAGREALGCAAAMGLQFGAGDLCVLATAAAVDELVSAGFLEISGQDRARFRHALVRDAVYRSLPWARRREYHRRIAEQYLAGGTLPAGIRAEQWLLAGEPRRARPHLLAAAEAACESHAYRDAALTLRIALETWPEEEDPGARAETLERLGRCAELAGDIEAAVAALKLALGGYRDPGDIGRVHRALAGLFQVRGDWDLAIAARFEAAGAFCAAALDGDAATEWLAAASHLSSAGHLDGALRAVAAATRVLGELPRVDLQARALALRGQIRAKLGEGRAGVGQVREGLALALAAGLSGAAADAYYRLASALEHAPDYRRALEAYEAARHHKASQLPDSPIAAAARNQ
jgi:tetratricopeptide (TPR) repeat protein